ncbi:MAG TPA: CDP-alcohol phosphatidyltransferase family protein [Candidatus Binataceae bacterium]|nr:CDP-alcohol phosphatidyltransferase family protein [Candidatus Binataceae bacterium]
MAAPVHNPAQVASAKEPEGLTHLLNVPNFLTLCRVGSVPIFLSLLSRHHYSAAMYIFVAAALTDGLDGAVARWSDTRTELGAFLDPFADKVMVVSALVVLTLNGSLPGYILSVVAIRDLVIVGGYFMLSFFTGERAPMAPSILGKLSTFFQLACIFAALISIGRGAPAQCPTLFFVTVAVTSASGIHYGYQGLVWLRWREPEMFK